VALTNIAVAAAEAQLLAWRPQMNPSTPKAV